MTAAWRRAEVKEANLAGKELAEPADALHEIADKGDLAASRAQFDKVKTAAAKIEAVAPATYYCPCSARAPRPTTSPASARSAT